MYAAHLATLPEVEVWAYDVSQPHVDAINRQLVHYGQHIGQILFLAKHYKGRNWESLSMPRRRPAL